jgi:hypothetical protein
MTMTLALRSVLRPRMGLSRALSLWGAISAIPLDWDSGRPATGSWHPASSSVLPTRMATRRRCHRGAKQRASDAGRRFFGRSGCSAVLVDQTAETVDALDDC